jgi:hypothetical protein
MTAVELNGHVIVAGLGTNGYCRNGDRKMAKLQSKIDKRGNWLARVDFRNLNALLKTNTDDKARNKARSVYDAKRASLINADALCKSWKRQRENIKKNKEQVCRVLREEFATFAALFDVVIIGDIDLKQWHKGMSHAASSVLSALSLGTLIEKIQFKVSLLFLLQLALAGGQLVKVSEAWSTKLCSCCGALNDPGHSATYTCSHCGVKMNRDENGARSILILALSRVSCILGDYTVPRNPVMGGAPAVTS